MNNPRRDLDLPPESLIDQAIGVARSTNNPAAAQTFLNERVPNPLAGLVPGTLGAATVTRLQAAQRYPQYSTLTAALNAGDSIYHALQATLQRRLSSSLNFMVSYSFSRAIGNSLNQQNPYDSRDARGASGIDRTHSFSTNLVYRLPFGTGKVLAGQGWMAKLLGGFQLNGILQAYTGTPLSITESGGNGLGIGTARPDVVGDTLALSRAIQGTVAANGNVNWINPAAYAIVNGRYGNAPASDSRLRAPGFWQFDLGLIRDFAIKEPLVVRFRAEAFNAFNHANLATVDTNLNSPTFGQISGVSDPRIFQFGLELKF